MTMKPTLKTLAISVLIVGGLSACSNHADEFDALRSEIAGVAATANAADAKATQAQTDAAKAAADAAQAAADAEAASEKADRIFRENLRK